MNTATETRTINRLGQGKIQMKQLPCHAFVYTNSEYGAGEFALAGYGKTFYPVSPARYGKEFYGETYYGNERCS